MKGANLRAVPVIPEHSVDPSTDSSMTVDGASPVKQAYDNLDDLPSAGPIPDQAHIGAPVNKDADLDSLPDAGGRLGKVFEQVGSLDPDRAAKVIDVAAKTGEPEGYVDQNLDQLHKATKAPSGNFFQTIESRYPGTTKFLNDPKNMAVAHDDVDNVAKHEQLIGSMHQASSLWDDWKSGWQNSVTGLTTRQGLPDAVLGPDANMADRLVSQAGQLVGDFPTMVAGGMAGAEVGGSVGATAGGVAGASFAGVGAIPGVAIGGTIGAMVGGGAGAFAAPAAAREAMLQTFKQGAVKDLPDLIQRTSSIVHEASKQGLVGALTSVAGPIAKGLVGGTVVPLAAEIGTMTVAGKAVEGETPTASDFVEGALMVGGMHGATHAGGYAVAHAVDEAKAKQAKQFYTALGDTAEASKLRERLPQAHQDLIKDLTADGPVENVLIPREAFDTYFQSKQIDPGAVAGDLGISDQYNEASQTGGDVSVPLSTWVNKVVGTEHYKGLQNDVKFSPDDLTTNQVEQRKADIKSQITELEARREAAKAANGGVEPEPKPTADESGQKIYDERYQQMIDAGRSESEAKQGATLHAQAMKSLAERTGADPYELAQRFKLEMQKRGLPEHYGANDLNQDGFEFAKNGEKDQTEHPLPKDVSVTQAEEPRALPASNNEALKTARENAPIGSFKNSHTGESIKVDKGSIDKIVSQGVQRIKNKTETGYREHLMALEHVDSLLENAVHLTSKEDTKGRGNDWQYYFAPLKMGGKDYNVKLEVKKDGDSLKLHNLAVVKDTSRGDAETSANSDKGTRSIPAGKVDVADFTDRIKASRDKNTFFQSEPKNAPAFYSKLEKTAKEKMGGSASPEQIKGMLREIKPEELKWSGLDKFLDGKSKVTKQELLDHLRASQLEIEEITKSEKDTSYAKYVLPGGENYREMLFRMPPANGKDFKFSEEDRNPESWTQKDRPSFKQLPHKEVLENPEFAKAKKKLAKDVRAEHPGTKPKAIDDLITSTLKSPRIGGKHEISGASDELNQKFNDLKDKYDKLKNPYKDDTIFTKDVNGERFLIQRKTDLDGKVSYELAGHLRGAINEEFPTFEAALKDIENKLTNEHERNRPDTYKSGHFDETNVLAHTRLNDRVDSEGKKVLHAEEIQSDWHQEGRKKGYRQEGPAGKNFKEWLKDNGRDLSEEEINKQFKSEEGAEVKAWLEDQEKAYANTKAVPEAPFKKTWHEFVLKRLIREAAEKGYDKLSWTTGDQQAARYDLAKQVDKVSALKDKDGSFYIEALKDGKIVTEKEGVKESELEGLFGKDLAKKIAEESGDQEESGYRNYSGKDLKVGGEGMKGFYDKILPDFMNKFGKKFGAKVEESKIGGAVEDQYQVEQSDQSGLWYISSDDGIHPGSREYETEKAAEKDLARLRAKESTTVHSIEINDEMRKAALQEGFALFQPGEDNAPRGRIQLGDGQSIIEFFKDANRSTFLHESGHYFLDIMGHLAADENATPQVKDDYQAIRDWMGLKDGEEIGVAQHEQFARGFEAYLMEGKAPSTALRQAFSRFKQWLTSIYKTAKNLKVELSPEIREVMDRMVATDDEIKQAENTIGYNQFKVSGLTKEISARLNDLAAQARERAESTLMREQMKEVSAQHKQFLKDERVRLKSEAEAEVKQLPVFKASEEIQTAIGSKKVHDLAAKMVDGTLMDEDAAKFETAAELHGFADGKDLATNIVSEKANDGFNKEVAARVEAGMAQHDDLRNSLTIKAEALKLVHNEKMTELIALEHQILSDKVESAMVKQEVSKRKRIEARIEAQAAKEQAKKILDAKPAKDASNARTYITAERNAASKAAVAISKGDFAKAAQAKREQMLNHALASEAMRNREEYQKSLDFLDKASKRGNDLKDMPYAFNKQIDQLLTRFGLKDAKAEDPAMLQIAKDMFADKKSPEEIANATGLKEGPTGWTPESLTDVQSRMNDLGYALEIPASILTGTKSFKEMTMQELRDLKSTIKTISTIGKNSERYLGLYDKMDIKEAAKEFRAEVEKNVGKPKESDLLPGSKIETPIQRAVSIISNIYGGIARWMDNALTITDKFDGLKDDGPAKRNIYRPIKDAADREASALHDAMTRLDEIGEKHIGAKEFAKYKDTRFNIDGRNFTKEEILSMALNWGNEGNRQRLMDGFGFDEAKMQRIFKHLDKKDWDFAQNIWDDMNTYWSKTKALEMEINGVEPEKIQADAFSNEHGNYEGGYYPAVYDGEKSSAAFKNNLQKDALFKTNSAAKAATDQGFLQARATKVTRPLRLSLDVIKGHYEDVIHDLEFRRAVIDVNRFLNQTDAKTAIQNAIGVRGYAGLNEYLRAAAAGSNEPTGFGDQAARWFRFRTTFFNLGYRLVSAPKIAIENGVNVASEIGISGAARAVKNYFIDGGVTHQMIMEKSAFMKERASHLNRDFADINDKWRGSEVIGPFTDFKHFFTAPEDLGDVKMKAKGVSTDFKKFAFAVHAIIDQGFSSPLWSDTYQRAIAKHGNEKLAITQADESVKRTFMSGGKADQSAVMRGNEKQKLLTMAFSYQSMMWNRFSRSNFQAGMEWSQGNKSAAIATAARATVYQFMMPAIVAAVTREILRNSSTATDDDSEHRMAATLIEEGTPLKFVPVLRDLVSYAAQKGEGRKSAEFHISPIEEAAQAILDPAMEAARATFGDHELSDKFTEKTVNAISLLLGVPKPVNDLAFNFMDWQNENGEATWKDALSRRTKN